MERGHQVDALYLDFSKAFESLNHALLMEKLHKYGVDQAMLAWLGSYLAGRTLQVRVGGSLSSPFLATSGFPQGSHLGPLLFLIYVQDLVCTVGEVGHSLYADDLKLYRTIKEPDDQQLLQASLNHVAAWGKLNGLRLNPTDQCLCGWRDECGKNYRGQGSRRFP